MDFTALYESRAAAFEGDLSACTDSRAAAARACRFVDELLEAFSGEAEDVRVRARAVMLCRVAKSALSGIEAVTESDVRAIHERERPAKARLRAALHYAPGVIAGALSVWLYLSGQVNPAFLSLLCATLSVLAARERARPIAPERYEAAVRVHAHDLSRHVAFLCREIDQLLPEREAPPHGAGPSMALLEAAQMLMEAELTKDGDYALKSVPQFVDALERDDVRFSKYEDGDSRDFDLLPGPKDGATIRPAVRRHGELLLRGQAMVKR